MELNECQKKCNNEWENCVGFSRYNYKLNEKDKGECWWVDNESNLVKTTEDDNETLFYKSGLQQQQQTKYRTWSNFI